MSTCFVGEIRLFAFSRIPTGWVACNGQTLNISEYPALYSLLGTLYGGNGSTTVGVPNLNGRLVIGAGQGLGLPNYPQGAKYGTETETLGAAEVPAHSHALMATSTPATDAVPGPTYLFAANSDGAKHYALQPAKATWLAVSAQSVTAEGGNASHNNIMPSMGLLYCMATQGEYPQQQ
jgi:microcystin-dependent protein